MIDATLAKAATSDQGQNAGRARAQSLPDAAAREVDPGAARLRAEPSRAAATTIARGCTALRVLIADDNVDAALTLGMLLALEGHDVQIAGNGLDAVALAATGHPHVVVLDIGMPGLDGLEVARRLRSEPDGDQMLLLAVTGWGNKEDRRRSQAAGFNHHYTKPVDPTELIDCIDAWRTLRGLR